MPQTSSKNIVFLVYFSVFFSAVFGGAGFSFMKNALDVFPVAWFVFLRFFLTSVCLLPFLAARVRNASGRTLTNGFITGVLFFAATVVQLQGIAQTTAGRSAFINSTSVIIIPALQALLLRRAPSWRVVCGCLLCLFGMGLLALQSAPGGDLLSARRGELLVFAGTCIFAVKTLFFKYAVRESDPHVLSFMEFLTLAVLALPAALTQPFPAAAGVKAWSGVIYSALMMNVAMIMVVNNALRYITPTSTVVLGSMQSVYGALFGVLLLGETVSWQLLFGGAAILSGILISVSAAWNSFVRSPEKEKGDAE